MDERLIELRALCADAGGGRTETEIPRITTVRGEAPEHEQATVIEPTIHLVLQGSKMLTIGNRTLRYDPASCFVMTMDLPATGMVTGSPEGMPYLSVALTLDPERVASVVAGAGPQTGDPRSCAFSAAPVDPEMLDAWL